MVDPGPAPAAPHPHLDPRDVVTPDVYRLDPALLGTPLARPWRRGVAIAIDGLLITLLANATSVLFGLAAAVVLLRVSSRSSGGGYIRRSARLGFRFAGALVLFVVALNGWDAVSDMMDDDEEETARASSAGVSVDVGDLSGMEGLRMAADVALLSQAETEEDARERAAGMIPVLRRSGMSDADIQEMLIGIAEVPGKPWMAAAMDSVVAGLEVLEESGEFGGDSLAVAYAAALSEGDSVRLAELRPRLAMSLAHDTIAHLRAELQDAQRDEVRLARQLEQAREEAEEGPGILAALRTFADDLGLGFGWAGLYFTAFLALWQGRTPGKRLLRVRVIRLDGKPIGWWASFERFGGYAASLATGLLGFFQILWDRNRQGIHDKISETVVVNG